MTTGAPAHRTSAPRRCSVSTNWTSSVQRREAACRQIGLGGNPKVRTMDTSMIVSPFLPSLKGLAQALFGPTGRCNVHQPTESVPAPLKLCNQPLRGHLAVCVRARQPPRTPPQQFSGGRGPGDADAACIQPQRIDPLLAADEFRSVRAVVQRNNHLHRFTAQARIQGRPPDRLQAPLDAGCLVVGRKQHAYHRRPSRRANDIAPRVHPCSTKSASR